MFASFARYGLIKRDSAQRELIEMACAWLTGASEGQSRAKPWPLEQLFLHAKLGLVQWKEAYVWPGAALPPADFRECGEREGD